MKLSSLAVGTAVGAAAGAIGVLLTGSMGGKTKLKRKTVKAMHAVGAMMDSISDYLHR